MYKIKQLTVGDHSNMDLPKLSPPVPVFCYSQPVHTGKRSQIILIISKNDLFQRPSVKDRTSSLPLQLTDFASYVSYFRSLTGNFTSDCIHMRN